MPPKGHPVTDITFSTLGVPAPLVSVLAADGKTEPFPIQVDTLPDTLAGRDVLGRGKTGSGKTIAFALPLVARLGTTLAGGRRRPGRPLALVLAPTRELATQIDAVLAPLAAAYGLKTTTIFGGINQKRQVDALRAGVDIVVACPGRLEDLMKQGFVTLDAIEITVLDEADHMADLGFLPGRHPHHGQDPHRRPASAVLGDARQRRGQARQALPPQRGAPLGRRGHLARRRDDPPRVRGRRRRREERRS